MGCCMCLFPHQFSLVYTLRVFLLDLQFTQQTILYSPNHTSKKRDIIIFPLFDGTPADIKKKKNSKPFHSAYYYKREICKSVSENVEQEGHLCNLDCSTLKERLGPPIPYSSSDANLLLMESINVRGQCVPN